MSQRQVGIRIVFVGDTGVGKTSLIRRFVSDEFVPTESATVGAVHYTHDVQFGGETVKLQIWDTAGQEQYRALGPIYYRNARAGIAVCDLTNPDSIDGLARWIDAYRANADESFVVVAANKGDLIDDTEVTTAVISRVESLRAKCIVTSAETGEGVQELFFAVAQHFLEAGDPVGLADESQVDLNGGASTAGGCC
jgi:small GTP-binding protein